MPTSDKLGHRGTEAFQMRGFKKFAEVFAYELQEA